MNTLSLSFTHARMCARAPHVCMYVRTYTDAFKTLVQVRASPYNSYTRSDARVCSVKCSPYVCVCAHIRIAEQVNTIMRSPLCRLCTRTHVNKRTHTDTDRQPQRIPGILRWASCAFVSCVSTSCARFLSRVRCASARERHQNRDRPHTSARAIAAPAQPSCPHSTPRTITMRHASG